MSDLSTSATGVVDATISALERGQLEFAPAQVKFSREDEIFAIPIKVRPFDQFVCHCVAERNKINNLRMLVAVLYYGF